MKASRRTCRVHDERVAGLLARAGDDVDDARREDLASISSARRSAEVEVCSEGFITTVLPAISGARDLARGEHQRVVEGDDPPDDAERLHQRVVEALGSPGIVSPRSCSARPAK